MVRAQNGGGRGGAAGGGGGKSQFQFRPTEPVGFGAGGNGDAAVDIPLDNMNVREDLPFAVAEGVIGRALCSTLIWLLCRVRVARKASSRSGRQISRGERR